MKNGELIYTNFLDDLNLNVFKNELFDNNEYIMPEYKQISQYPDKYYQIVCSDIGLYQIPTKELIDFLQAWVIPGKTIEIEIGSGRGIIGKALGIPCTDSKIQETDEMRKLLRESRVAPVTYGEHVEKLEAREAIKKYKPSVVIASWFTGQKDMHGYEIFVHGCNEENFIDDIDTYILIGNESVHRTKSLLTRIHREYTAKWLCSRAHDQKLNRIYIWTKNPVMIQAKKYGFKMKLSKADPRKVPEKHEHFSNHNSKSYMK